MAFGTSHTAACCACGTSGRSSSTMATMASTFFFSWLLVTGYSISLFRSVAPCLVGKNN